MKKKTIPSSTETALPKLTEQRFQSMIVEMAHLYRWRIFHPRKSLTKAGRWITALQGDKGFVDLVLARAGNHVLFCELKTDVGRLSEDQERWRDVLLASGAEYRLWRPSNWKSIEETLR